MTRDMDCALIGKWRIIEADPWDRDYLDLVEPAHITVAGDGHGEFTFGGDGSAELDDNGSLEIEIRFHLGDEAILKARKW